MTFELRFYWWKAAINLKSQVRIDEWTESVTFLLRISYCSKSPIFPTAQFTITPQESTKVYCRLYMIPAIHTRFAWKFSISETLYFILSFNTASLHVELINFRYNVSLENLWTGKYYFILPFFQILLLHLSYWEEICNEFHN